MVIKKKSDLLISLVLFMGTSCMYYQMQQIDVATVHAMGPNFFPGILLTMLFILSACLAWQSIDFKKKSIAESTPEQVNIGALILQLTFVGTLLGYVFMLPHLGYIPSTILFLLSTITLLGERNIKNIAIYAAISCLVTGIIYYIFAKILLLFLP